MLCIRRTLTAVVVDIGIIRVVLDCLLETPESLSGITLFHVDASDFHQTLRE